MFKLYDTVLSIPGMENEIKITLKVSRKNQLLINKVIERGLNGKESEDKTVSFLTLYRRNIADCGRDCQSVY